MGDFKILTAILLIKSILLDIIAQFIHNINKN